VFYAVSTNKPEAGKEKPRLNPQLPYFTLEKGTGEIKLPNQNGFES
jgi:hypothetical protein